MMPVDPEAIVELRAQVRVFGSQPSPLERHGQLVQQLLELERLRDEALGAEARHLDRLRTVPYPVMTMAMMSG